MKKVTLKEATHHEIAMHIYTHPALWGIQGIVGEDEFDVYVVKEEHHTKFEKNYVLTVVLSNIKKEIETDYTFKEGVSFVGNSPWLTTIKIRYNYLDLDKEIEVEEEWGECPEKEIGWYIKK